MALRVVLNAVATANYCAGAKLVSEAESWSNIVPVRLYSYIGVGVHACNSHLACRHIEVRPTVGDL